MKGSGNRRVNESYQKMLDGQANAAAAEKGNNKEIER
jgi:hypothetical protein